MYTKQEASRLKQAFWTAFGKYMQPVLSADGAKVSWVNYKTGISGITFKMDADSTHATIAIVLSHPDAAMQQMHYNQMVQLKTMLATEVQEEWNWQANTANEYGRTGSKIGIELLDVNICRPEQWPELITFFKQRIIALDAFWSSVRYSFE